MSAFVIATHRFDGDGVHYRSLYYRETLDGRPRFGAKIEAHRFTGSGADVVAGQLRQLMPANFFYVIAEADRPPRAEPLGDAGVPMPFRQTEIAT